MVYYALVEADSGAFSVSFPDLEGCFSCSYADSEDPLKEALENAKEALNLYLTSAQRVSEPKRYKGANYYPIEVSQENIVLLNIRWLRKNNSLSQKQVAERLHITQQAYQRIESGKYGLNLNTVIQIAKVYNKSLKDVVS